MCEPNPGRVVVEPADIAPADFYKLLNSCVVPRPIAWVSSVDDAGVVNLAPYSLFTVASSAPPIIVFVSLQREKDSVRNARNSGEFTVNVTSVAQLEAVNATAETVPPEVDEATLAGVDMESGTLVRCPRVRDSVAALECRTVDVQHVGNSWLVFGEVLGIVTKEGSIDPMGLVPPGRIEVLGKLGGPYWSGIGDVINQPRPDML